MSARKSWRPALAIETLRDELNAARPKRSKASDGIVGDLAHSSRTSDHNPNSDGVVRAFDITHDEARGVDGDVIASTIASRLAKHPALGPGAYVIWNRRIISTDRIDKSWRRYAGINPHRTHVHVSVGRRASSYDSTAAWLVLTADVPAPSPSLRTALEDELQAWLRALPTKGGSREWREVGRLRELISNYTDEQIERIIAELDSAVRAVPLTKPKTLAGRRRAAQHARQVLSIVDGYR